MNKTTYGESLFERYLQSQGIIFEREPALPEITQRIDFIVDHPSCGKILLEVKDIENEPPLAAGFFDPDRPIRAHIQEGTRKFKKTSHYVCALVLAAPPGSFVQLNDPNTVMGPMYGNLGFRENSGELEAVFILGEGKMIRKTKFQNTRIAALISVTNYDIWHYSMRQYVNTDDGMSRAERVRDIQNGQVELPHFGAAVPGVTVWENGVAHRKLPKDLFRGEMDAWWESSDGHQRLTFVGGRRQSLHIDKTSR